MKLGLGTAQFGLDYGVTNPGGKLPENEVAEILETARTNGIEVIDTAVAYGSSEEVLGRQMQASDCFKLITKTLPIKREAIDAGDVERLRDTFFRSLERLRQPRVYALLVHHAGDLLASRAELLMAQLEELKSSGLVEKVGVSVYTGTQIDEILAAHEIDLIQLPLNVFDQRLLGGGHLARLKARGVEIHARSVFLQGLLLLAPEALPERFNSLANHLRSYCTALAQSGLTRAQGALSFIAATMSVDHAIVGVLSAQQFEELLHAMKTLPTGHPDFSRFAWDDLDVIDPTRWKAA